MVKNSRPIDELKKPNSKFFKYMLFIGVIAVVVMVYFIFFAAPGQFKEKNKSGKKQESNNLKAELSKDLKTSEPNFNYYYAGIVNDKYLLVDNYGNLYKLNLLIYEPRIYNYEKINHTLKLLNNKTGVVKYNPAYIKELQSAPGGGGRGAPTSPTASAQAPATEKWIVREVYVNIE